ncbi:MAG: 50S ribosomal protein L5 [Candidatus Woesearchaeota archaeon]
MAKTKTTPNPMREIRVAKVTLNIGTGKDQSNLERAMRLLKHITGIAPVKTTTTKRIAAWGLRPGLPIGCKITMRHFDAQKIIPRLVASLDNKMTENQFDENGNISFGIKEYIDIKDTKYEPEIGSMGLQCSITLERPGFRIKKRKLLKKTVPLHHRIAKTESIEFMKTNFNIKMASDDE